jgi:hypothetical protein
MKRGVGVVVLLAVGLLVPFSAWAGIARVTPAPALGDIGLIALGVGLVGVGIASLRKR